MMMYPENLIAPMENELTSIGFKALKTEKEVNDCLNQQKGSILLFINSACGCSGAGARSGVVEALELSTRKPDKLLTVFAGVDEEAFTAVQYYIKPYPLSSPAVALIKNNVVMYFMERHQLKGAFIEDITYTLQCALEAHC